MNPNEQPTNVPTPAPAANPEPTPAPAPSNEPVAPAPFTAGIANDVPVFTQPTEPTAPVEPTPTDPQPAPQPTPAPAANPAPEPAPQPKVNSYEEYLESLVGKPEEFTVPKPQDVPADDPEALNKFFSEYGEVIKKDILSQVNRQAAVQNFEAVEWNKAFTKYPEIKDNAKIRDTIHSLRMGAFSRGEVMSPTQAADFLVGALHDEYKKGVNDTKVTTEIVDNQPTHIGTGAPAAPTGVNYNALQDGGTEAAIRELESLMAAGKI